MKIVLPLCFTAALFSLISCTDISPVGSGTGNNFSITGTIGIFSYTQVITDLTGAPPGPVQGFTLSLITDQLNIHTHVGADFAADGSLGSPSYVACNNLQLAEKTHTQNSDGTFPLFDGLLYQEPPRWDTTHYTYGDAMNWETILPNGETVRDTVVFPPSLSPVTPGNDTIYPYDTVSISGGLMITWSNAQPGKRVEISLYAYPSIISSAAPGSMDIVTMDTGRYALSLQQLQNAGMPTQNALLQIQIRRGNYHANKTYNNGQDRLGSFVYTETDQTVYLKP